MGRSLLEVGRRLTSGISENHFGDSFSITIRSIIGDSVSVVEKALAEQYLYWEGRERSALGRQRP